MRLVKAINVEEIKPYSIVLGTSRAEMAIDPEHEYFIKPSYNLANAGSTMYETKYYLKEAILQGKLKKVLLVADWRMFNDVNMKQVADFETYFENRNIYKYLLNYKVFEDSLFTIKNQNKLSLHKSNGQMTDRYVNDVLLAHGGQYKTMLAEEKNYYKNFTNNNSYKDTKKDSFEDFKEILQMCYRNNIKLDIIFGPSHIRQWEAFDYYHGYETFLKWKKDIVLFVEKIGLEENKIPFNILDFSVYHRLTAENVPKELEQRMEFHFEGSHYTNKLGLIVLDRLSNNSLYKDFGVYINSSNIDNHLENLRKDRLNFIDIKEYRKEVFGE
ncbi:hypothetical protein [Aliarcobacter cryaerophilus]|uniref:hypothetical protein n=1 Tax=Aliarcobacter cryaerophilus TaxID=28198 RepID=UPI0015E8593D|nr:hypothetical protein [Aliarcobacter cryaerophilus]